MNILGARLAASKLLWKSRSHSLNLTWVYLLLLLRSWDEQMHGQDHYYLGEGVYENTQDWFNGSSVRSHSWQGMQGEVLRDGVEVPEARSKQNSCGWIEAHAPVNSLNSWILSPGLLAFHPITRTTSGIERQEPRYLDALTGYRIRPLACPPLSRDSCVLGCVMPTFRSRRVEKPCNRLPWSVVIGVFLGEMRTPSTPACEGPCYPSSSG